MVGLARGLEFAFVESGPALLSRLRAGPASGNSLPRVRLFNGSDESGDPLGAPGGLTLTEVSDSGSVPFLQATNTSEMHFFLIAGQVVRGGKQNRGINIDILIEAGKSARIPVTCVEQGRWSGTARDRFRHGGIEPISLRSRKMHHAHRSMRMDAAPAADQGEVWDEIAFLQRSVGAESSTGDVLESIAHASRGPEHRASSRRTGSRGAASRSARAAREQDRERRHREAERADLEEEFAQKVSLAQHIVRELAEGIAQPSRHHFAMQLRLRHTTARIRELRERIDALAAEDAAPRAFLEAETPSPERIAEANAAALQANGMLVFFNGEFLAGDLFADPAWFRTIYGDLRDSALLSWTAANQRMRAKRRADAAARDDDDDDESSATRHSAERLARSIMRDALAGDWEERKPAAHGRSFTLEHPFLEGAALSDGEGTPLHVVVGAARLPEILQRDARRSRRHESDPFA